MFVNYVAHFLLLDVSIFDIHEISGVGSTALFS